eukprot:TRINITY_DN1205_c0_g2_i1.p1 TRINITY_DN1205_c0_g2~~TRINITY_DN1205_c0_g2_i1.p1  ORF type:complete len:325 (-),score=75.99 TRINITY_DN1205_c0_g2_i1:115-993(-)
MEERERERERGSSVFPSPSARIRGREESFPETGPEKRLRLDPGNDDIDEVIDVPVGSTMYQEDYTTSYEDVEDQVRWLFARIQSSVSDIMAAFPNMEPQSKKMLALSAMDTHQQVFDLCSHSTFCFVYESRIHEEFSRHFLPFLLETMFAVDDMDCEKFCDSYDRVSTIARHLTMCLNHMNQIYLPSIGARKVKDEIMSQLFWRIFYPNRFSILTPFLSPEDDRVGVKDDVKIGFIRRMSEFVVVLSGIFDSITDSPHSLSWYQSEMAAVANGVSDDWDGVLSFFQLMCTAL